MRGIAVAANLILIASTAFSDEIEKKSSVSIGRSTQVETDTYFQRGERVLEIRRSISLRLKDKHIIQQKVYWGNDPAVEYVIARFGSNDTHSLQFHSNTGVDVSAANRNDGSLESLSIVTTNLVILRAFRCINGLLSPLPRSEIERANGFQQEVETLFGDFTSGKINGDDFLDSATGIVNRHQSYQGTTNSSTVRGETPRP